MAFPAMLAEFRSDTPPLPVAVKPVDAETSGSFHQRLAEANGISPRALWAHLRTIDPSLPHERKGADAATALEVAGGLTPGWFAENRAPHTVPRRCPHADWAFTRCRHCSPLPAERAGCRRCGDGATTRVTHLSGLVCARHKRFSCGELDIDVSALPAHLDAETRMRESLTRRGITPGSGELELALALLSAAISDGHAALLHQRMLNVPRKLPITSDTLAYLLYPEIVELADIITEPSFCARLLNPRWGPNTQATLLVATVTGVLGTDPSTNLDAVARDSLAHDNDAVSASYGMVGTSRKCTMQRAFVSAAYTHRACLLRHLDAIRMPIIPRPPSKGRAPTSGSVQRRPMRPDPVNQIQLQAAIQSIAMSERTQLPPDRVSKAYGDD